MASRRVPVSNAGAPESGPRETMATKKRRVREWRNGSSSGQYDTDREGASKRVWLREPMSSNERADSPMSPAELSAFNVWIVTAGDRSPVPRAGAAKRVPDGDLAMFRDSRLVSPYPPDIPVRGSFSTLPPAISEYTGRLQSSESDARKSIAPRVDRLIDEKIKATADVSLPPLNSSLGKEKQVLQALLHEISGSKVDHNQEVRANNQHSARRGKLGGSEICVPPEVFYEVNSIQPLKNVNLSDWTEFVTAIDCPVAAQITANLSERCVEVDLSGLSRLNGSRDLVYLLANCTHLQSLHLSHFDGIPKAAFHGLARRLLSLRLLDLSYSENVTDGMLNAIVSAFPKLLALNLSGCQNITDEGLLLVAKLSLLEQLWLDGCLLVSDSALLHIVRARGDKLRLLSVRRCQRVTNASIQEFLSTLPTALEELNISGCEAISDDAIEFLVNAPSYYGRKRVTAYAAFQKLDISGCRSLAALSFSWIAAACPLLTDLNVAECPGICDKSIRALSSLERLKMLDMSRCPRVSDESMSEFFLAKRNRSFKRIELAHCPQIADKTVSALVDACSGTLNYLDLQYIEVVSPQTLIKLIRTCRKLTHLLVSGQPGVNRAVLANLASCNKVLQVLNLSRCENVDDLALYPLLVMNSIEELHLNGIKNVTVRGFKSLPRNLVRLYLQDLPSCNFGEECFQVLGGHLRKLEVLDVSRSTGVSPRGLVSVVEKSKFLHQLNVFGCGVQIQPSHICALLDSKRRDTYMCDVIIDKEVGFMGFASVDPEASTRARRRELMAEAAARRKHAATWIQSRFRFMLKQRKLRSEQKAQNWDKFCAAIDIQRIFRGYQCRKLYGHIQREVTKVVVFLQYKWRKKLQERRTRRAVGYWTNRLVLKCFLLWKKSHEAIIEERLRTEVEMNAAKAIGFWSVKTLPRVFDAWHTFAHAKRGKAKKALGFWKCQSLPRVLGAWQELVAASKRRRVRLTHVFLNVVSIEALNSSAQLPHVTSANAFVKRVIWKLWREFMVVQKQFVLQATLSILVGNLLPWAFREWKNRAKYERQLRAKNTVLLARVFHREKARVWGAWQVFLLEQRAKKRAAARFSISTRTKCFLKWQRWHREQVALRTVSARVANRLRMTQIHRAVCQWYEYMLDRQAGKNAQRRALMFLTNGTLVRVFTAWGAYADRVKSLRARFRALMENANLAYTFTMWVWHTKHAQYRHAMATRIQAFWRGIYSRRQCEDRYYFHVWAVVLIQTAWRGRLARALFRAATRKRHLREYLRAERERDRMAAEEEQMREFDHALAMIVQFQRRWRGVAARSLFFELRRARYIRRKQEEVEMQEIARAEARRRQLERIQKEKLRQASATEIQRHVRGWLARREFAKQRELLREIRCAVRVQAVYRGRMSRRRTAALRRSYITRMEVLARRAVEGRALRAMGAKDRSTQRGLRSFLTFFGLDPATFLTDVRDVFREVREDFQTLTAFVSVVRAKVQANAASVALRQQEQGNKPLERQRPLLLKALGSARMAKLHLDNVDRMVHATNEDKEREDSTIRPADAVRIVLQGHPRCGETAFVLAVHDAIAQVKLDVDGALEFLPVSIPATKTEPARLVMHKVPALAFSGQYGDFSRGGKLTQAWRDALEAYAASIADESKRYCAARVIQCAARTYLARMRYQQELEAQGINAARRQEALLRVLKTFRCANTRIASLLVQLRLIRPLNVPPGLPDEPLAVQIIIDRCLRWVARKQELHAALLTLAPIALPLDMKKPLAGVSSIELPVPFTRIVDKFVFYPLQWLQRATAVPVARRLEKQGMTQIASFIGGAEFAKTFEQRNTRAREHFFLQLAGSSFCESEGWAIVHGVFQKRKIVTQHPTLWNATRRGKKKTVTRLVPHGWGVAHLLTGRVKGKKSTVNWLERNSIESRFKSLQLVRALKQQERAERLEAQILTRQGTWNILRSTEGARGYAKRHAELSILEEKTKVFFARFQRERELRDREELMIFDEEALANNKIAEEKRELAIQGRKLSELQQQVPEPVVEIALLESHKTALEFLVAGCSLEVEFDDEAWYECRLLSLDAFDTQTAEIEYIADKKRERIKLVEQLEEVTDDGTNHDIGDGDAEDTKTKRLLQVSKTKMTVTELAAAAAAKKAAKDVPFRRWRAGKAVDVIWEAPLDNGARITQYVLEWKDERVSGSDAATGTPNSENEVTGTCVYSGKTIVAGTASLDDDDSELEGELDEEGSDSELDIQEPPMKGGEEGDLQSIKKRRRRLPTPPTKTTIWPIAPESEQTMKIRVAAENMHGVGLASIYLPLDTAVLVDVSYKTAVPLTRPPPDTSKKETRERHQMGLEDRASLELQRRLTCTICNSVLGSEPAVHEHICREHDVPLLCPFRSCSQICASERALRYHIWRCSVAQPTPEERANEWFMEIFNISRQYCLRKARRHILPAQSALRRSASTKDLFGGGDQDEEEFLESKYRDAVAAWITTGAGIHEKRLAQADKMRQRERDNRYEPPKSLYGVDFASPELNVARRNTVLNTIAMLREDLESFRVETNTQLDAWGNEERELQEYIALKTKRIKVSEEEWQKQSLRREKKKAEKSLAQVQQQIAALVESSTTKINTMEAELVRLGRIEQAFVPFTHHVIRLLRLGAMINETHEKTNSILNQHRVILEHFQEDLRKLMMRMNTEVDTLEAWDAMIAARKRQLEALSEELTRLQRQHAAEMQSYKQQRDAGDELFELGKLRQQQSSVLYAREIAEKELLSRAKRTRVEAAASAERAAKAAKEAAELGDGSELQTSMASLKIANHDLQLHSKFLKGKAADAEYLADGNAIEANEEPTAKPQSSAKAPKSPGSGTSPGKATNHTSTGQSTSELSSHLMSAPNLPESVAKLESPKHSFVRSKDVPTTWVRIECDFQDGRIAGAVRVEFNDGSVYEGPWVEDATSYDKPCDVEPLKTKIAPTHWGKFTTRDGAVWQGEEVDNFFSPFIATGPHFEVALAPPLRQKYSGAMRAGNFHGFGVLEMTMTLTRGEYVGEWREGKRHGYGIEKFDNGEIYEGYWEFDRYHGDGELVYDDGSRYVGTFSRGMWHGSGVRTLVNGDQIIGDFHDGFLDGQGIVEFADKRHYHGEFKRTRRHGLGALTYPNGDRYEGPFEDDEMHGDGKFYSRSTGNGELLVRLGRWVRGERVAWLSQPSSQVATATFLGYFTSQRKVEGEVEVDLRIPQFRTPYAVMVARMLPHLPEGVDADDPFVKAVVAQLAKTQSVVIGADVLTKSQQQYANVVQERSKAEGAPLESLRNEVDACERECRSLTRDVEELTAALHEKVEQEEVMQVKIELFWKRDSSTSGSTGGAEAIYREAVDRLRSVPLTDWYKLRASSFGSQALDVTYMSLLEAFAKLLSFTSNRYLTKEQALAAPPREEIARLLSNSDENVLLGDKEGLIHRYDVKALYVLPLFDAYSFAEGSRRDMLLSLTSVVHHPRLRTGNVRLYQISPALAAICAWVHAAFRYARRAMEIAPVVDRALKQLVIVDFARKSLRSAQEELDAATARMEAARKALKVHRDRLEDLQRQERELKKVLDDIEALDRAQHAPLVKQSIKRPETARPASAAPPASGSSNEPTEAAPTGPTTVNRRQVFGNAAADDKPGRVHKEDVLASILGDEERANELVILKKEVCKVLDKNGSPVPLADFPAQFEKWLLKPLDPTAFGVKKLRTLLLMLDDVCFIAEPTKPGDVETVRLRPPPMEDEDEVAEETGEAQEEQEDDVVLSSLSRGPPPPRLGCYCRVCPGVSYASLPELRVHETTKWHWWNSQRRSEKRKPLKWTLAATFWSEVYDGQSGEICYFNKMTGAVVSASDGPPLEMQANDVLLELLADPAAVESPAETEDVQVTEGGWEEVADELGNVYFVNRATGESSWTLPSSPGLEAAGGDEQSEEVK